MCPVMIVHRSKEAYCTVFEGKFKFGTKKCGMVAKVWMMFGAFEKAGT